MRTWAKVAERRERLTMAESERKPAARIPGWVAAVVVVGAALMALGAVLAAVRPAMLVSPHDEINAAVRVYAGYLTSRNLALAGMLLAALLMRARGALTVLMVLTGIVQLLDAGIDGRDGRWMLVPGVLVFAIVYFFGAARIAPRGWWKGAE